VFAQLRDFQNLRIHDLLHTLVSKEVPKKPTYSKWSPNGR
jgi:hypothetical protein